MLSDGISAQQDLDYPTLFQGNNTCQIKEVLVVLLVMMEVSKIGQMIEDVGL